MSYRVKENLLQIQAEIVPCQPKIIAVTKYYDEKAILECFDAGLRDFGESRAVDAVRKISLLPQDIRQQSSFHFIGHLQSNKAKLVVKHFDYIHSVDSLKIAQVISSAAEDLNKVQNILLQINNANEEQKFGFCVDDLFKDFTLINQLPGVKIVGLMNIAPLGLEKKKLQCLFSQIRDIRNKLENEFSCTLRELSMGMSQDYVEAAKEGATMLRIGRKLFT